MHKTVGDAADIHEIGSQQEERHRQQDEGIVGFERFIEEHHRGEPQLEDERRQAREAERERYRHPQHDEKEKRTEQHQRGHARRHRGLRHRAAFPARMRILSRKISPRKITQVAPASGQATKMNGMGSSASSDSWYQPNSTNLMPQ